MGGSFFRVEPSRIHVRSPIVAFQRKWHFRAAAGIPVYVISTYNTDYIFVKAMDLERAGEVLRTLGYEVEASTDCQRPEGPDVGLADENDTCGSSAPA